MLFMAFKNHVIHQNIFRILHLKTKHTTLYSYLAFTMFAKLLAVLYLELCLHPLCAHFPQPQSLHVLHCCYSNFALNTLVMNTFIFA